MGFFTELESPNPANRPRQADAKQKRVVDRAVVMRREAQLNRLGNQKMAIGFGMGLVIGAAVVMNLHGHDEGHSHGEEIPANVTPEVVPVESTHNQNDGHTHGE